MTPKAPEHIFIRISTGWRYGRILDRRNPSTPIRTLRQRFLFCFFLKFGLSLVVCKAGLARRDTGRLPGGQAFARAAMTATVTLVLNFTINYHVYIEYFDQELENINKSTLELVP